MRGLVEGRVLIALAIAAMVAAACVDDPTYGVDAPGSDGDGQYGEGQPGDGKPDSQAPDLPGVAVRALRSPLRVAAVPGGLLVSDPGLRMVLQMDPTTLTFQRGIHVDGKPLGVGYWGGFVLVGNATKETVEVYDGQGGRLLSDFGQGAVVHPSDIAVDENEALVFVVDGAAKAVRVFTPSGEDVLTISGPGSGSDRLANPIGVVADVVRREVLVSDYGTLASGGHASVKIFGYDGAFRAEIPGAGSCGSAVCSDGFSRPQGLAVGHDGRIYLADALLAKVLVFDRATLARVGEMGERDFARLPSDLAVGVAGDLFIVANGTRTLRVVRRGTAP